MVNTVLAVLLLTCCLLSVDAASKKAATKTPSTLEGLVAELSSLSDPGPQAPECEFYVEGYPYIDATESSGVASVLDGSDSITSVQPAAGTITDANAEENLQTVSISCTNPDGTAPIKLQAGNAYRPFINEWTGVDATLDNNLPPATLLLTDQNVTITNSYFILLKSTALASLVLQGGSVRILNSTFQNNSQFSAGGVLANGTNLEIMNSIFEFNKGKEGGAMRLGGDANVYIQNSIFHHNNGSQGAGVFAQNISKIVVESSDFTSNTAINGGGLFLQFCDVARLNNVMAEKNNATNNGGGLFLEACDAVVSDSHFTSNKGKTGGAANIQNEDSYTFDSVEFKSNTAKFGSGALEVNKCTGNIKGCTFTNNKGEKGGAIFQDTSKGNIQDCTFESNSASKTAGAVWRSYSSGNIDDCEFNSNVADNLGGAIYLQESKGKITDSIFNKNEAAQGNGVYLRKSPVSMTGNKGLTNSDVVDTDGS